MTPDMDRVLRLASRFSKGPNKLRLVSLRAKAEHGPDDIMEVWIDSFMVGSFSMDEWSWSISHPTHRIRPVPVPLGPPPGLDGPYNAGAA